MDLINRFKNKPNNHSERIVIILEKNQFTKINIVNILNQTLKVSLIYLITDTPMDPFEKDTCCALKTGNLSMLCKERNTCIMFYIKPNVEVLKDVKSLQNIIPLLEDNKVYNLKDMLIMYNTVHFCIDDIYSNKYGIYWS